MFTFAQDPLPREDVISWFAVMTNPGAEHIAEWHLRRKGYATFYPHFRDWVGMSRGRRSRMVKKPYMIRYIFVGLGDKHVVGDTVNLHGVNWDAPGVRTPGVSTVIYAPGGVPFPIPMPVMWELMERADRFGMIYNTKAKFRFAGEPGDKVVLGETSPYWNFICEIERIDDGDRIKVLIDTLGRKVPTLIRPEDVAEIHTKAGEIIPKGDPRMCKLASA